jgi:hypothetical protein
MHSQAKFKPTGHRRPVHRPRDYDKNVNDALGKAFDKYLGMCRNFSRMVRTTEECYKTSLECIEGIIFTLDEVNWLALKHRTADQHGLGERDAGAFISACHNTLPDKLIITDIDMDEYLGIYLPEDKTLVNTGSLYILGMHAEGLIVNLGDVRILGSQLQGAAINYGCVSDFMGSSSFENSLIANCGEAEKLGFGCRGRFLAVKNPIKDPSIDPLFIHSSSLTEAECAEIPELSEYLNNLRTDLETGVYHSKKEVETNIYDIIKRCNNG